MTDACTEKLVDPAQAITLQLCIPRQDVVYADGLPVVPCGFAAQERVFSRKTEVRTEQDQWTPW